uniref:DsbC family protein n=1 Tax=Methylomonas sp. PHL2-19 TaxID=3438878 RepID=UPI00402B405E
MKLLPAIFLLVVSSLAVAGQPPVAIPEVSTPTEAALFAKGAINAMKALPIDGFNMVEAGGETYFISRNGRFAFKGQLMDTWSKTPITRIEQVDSVMNRIPLADMKLNIDELGPVLVGKGKTPVVVFVDPQCRYCKKLQQQLPALADRYTFKIIPIAVLGPESTILVNKIECLLQTKDKEKATTALLNQDYAGLPEQLPGSCDKEPMQKAVITSAILGLTAVPFVIAQDGRTHKGAPDDLAGWLNSTQSVSTAKQ